MKKPNKVFFFWLGVIAGGFGVLYSIWFAVAAWIIGFCLDTFCEE